MIFTRNGRLLLCNTTISMARDTIAGFPRRYHSHSQKGFSGLWKCVLLRASETMIQLQLVDDRFETPRGQNVPSEAPIFHIVLEQVGSDVMLVFRYKWKKLICLFVGFFMFVILTSLLLTLHLYVSGDLKTAWMPFAVAIFLLSLGILWWKSNVRHDALAVKMFIELLRKNFMIRGTLER